eukprot:132699-Amphidinium_carterae.4
MEIKTTYKQTITTAIANKANFKQHRYHDYSVITSDNEMDEEYAKHIFIEIYQQSRDKNTIPHIH